MGRDIASCARSYVSPVDPADRQALRRSERLCPSPRSETIEQIVTDAKPTQQFSKPQNSQSTCPLFRSPPETRDIFFNYILARYDDPLAPPTCCKSSVNLGAQPKHQSSYYPYNLLGGTATNLSTHLRRNTSHATISIYTYAILPEIYVLLFAYVHSRSSLLPTYDI